MNNEQHQPEQSIIKRAFRVFSSNVWQIAFLCLTIYIPMFVAIELFPDRWNITIEDLTLETNIDKVLGYSTKMLMIMLPFISLFTASIVAMAKRTEEGIKVDIPYLLDHSLMRWHKLIMSTILYLSLLFISSFLPFFSIYFAVIFCFYLCITAITNKWGIEALFISRRMVKGRWWKTALFLFSIYIGRMILQFVLGTSLATIIPIDIMGTRLIIHFVNSFIITIFDILFALYFLDRLNSFPKTTHHEG